MLNALLGAWLVLAPSPSPDETEVVEAGAVEPEPTRAEAADDPAQAEVDAPLVVAVAGSAPFVVKDDGHAAGIAVALWKEVASRAEIPFRLQAAETIPDALAGVEQGRYDMAVGPISITSERAQRVSFTQPYYESPLSIVATPEGSGAWDRLRPFFTKAFAVGVGALLLVLALVGVALWWTERKHNVEQFPKEPVPGIAAGLWLALVTMTTVGYGDKAPVTPGGRVVTGIWMVIAMLTASSLTASIATALTLSQIGGEGIDSPEELAGHRVAVVSGAPAVAFAREHGARLETVDDVGEGLDRLARGQVDAVVHDRAVLAHELDGRDDETELVLNPGEYAMRGYGFAVPMGSTLVQRLDPAVLQVRESGMVRELMP